PAEKDSASGRYQVKVDEIRISRATDRSRIAAQKTLIEGEQLRRGPILESLKGALKKLEEARAYWRVAGERRQETITLLRIAETDNLLGEERNALARCNEALRIVQELGDRILQVETLNDIGFLYTRLGDSQKALENCTKGLALAQQTGSRRRQAE